MNMVKHLFLKDVRHTRVFLGFWLAITLAAGAAAVFRPGAGNLLWGTLSQLVLALVFLLQFLMMALIVPFLAHEEPTVGTTAFWLTRPIKRVDALKAKLLYAGVFFLLTPILINTLARLASHVPLSYVLPQALGDAIDYSAWLLLLFAVASLSRNFGGYALIGGVYFAIAIVCGALIAIVQQFGGAISPPVGPGLADTRELLSNLAAIAIFLTLVIRQFRGRRVFRSFALLAFELLLTLWIGVTFPWSIFPEPRGTITAEQAAQIEAKVDPSSQSQISEMLAIDGGEAPKRNVRGEFAVNGLPPGAFARAARVDGQLEVDGRVMGAAPSQQSFPAFQIDYPALATSVAPLYLIEPDSYFTANSTLLVFTPDEYEASRENTGVYRADVEFNLFQYRRVASLPLEVGAVHVEDRARISVEAVLKRTEGCQIVVRRQYANPLFRRDRRPTAGARFHFLLANEKTGEAFTVQHDGNSFHINATSGPMLDASNLTLNFSSDGLFNGCEIDEAWLADARLIIVRTDWLGAVEKPVVDENFSFRDSGGFSSSEPNRGAKDNMSELVDVELPDHPTREHVRDYILRINAISATQSSFGDKDPQVEMLAAVGNENLDLVLRHAGQHDHYAVWAAAKIADENDRDLILRYLPRMKDLSSLVIKLHWEEDARDTLLRGLDRDSYLPEEWLTAVANLDDPETYPALIRFFERGANPARTYDAIKNLPGIKLEASVVKVWRQERNGEDYGRISMEPIAMGYGIASALESAIQDVNDPDRSDWRKEELLKALEARTGRALSAADFTAWFEANKDDLRFDRETKTFIGEKPFTAAAKPAAAPSESLELVEPKKKTPATAEEFSSLFQSKGVLLKVLSVDDSNPKQYTLTVKGRALADNATIVLSKTADLDAAVGKIHGVISISAQRGKKIKTLRVGDNLKVPVTYE